MIRHVIRLATAFAFVFFASGCYAEVQKIKIAYVQATALSGVFICVKKGFCKTAEFEVELTPFVAGGQVLQAVHTGGAQLGAGSPIPHLYYLQRSQEIITVASASQSGTMRFLSGGTEKQSTMRPSGFFAVRADSPIKSVKDLKGKTIAGANAQGTWADLYLRKLLDREGLVIGRDLKSINLSFDLMPGALANKTVDGAFIWEPSFTLAQQKYGVRAIFTDLDVEAILDPKPNTDDPTGGGVVLWVRRDWAEKNRALLVSFMSAYKKSLTWLWDNYEDARLLGATEQGFAPEIGRAWSDASGPRNGKFSLDALARAQNLMVELGALKAPIPGWPEKFVDYSYLDAAK